MEQQNKLTEEEKAYQALRTQDMQDMPDLWSRIDTGFEEEVTKQQAARKKRRTRQFVLVAAAILIVIIAVPVGISSMRKSNMKEMKTETTADMHVTEAGKDEMADEADSALPNIADQTVQADSEIQESADASVNHMDGNGATEAQTDAAIAANQSGNQASEERNDGNNQMSYQTITQVILTQYDAQGKIVQQFAVHHRLRSGSEIFPPLILARLRTSHSQNIAGKPSAAAPKNLGFKLSFSLHVRTDP